MINEEQYSNLCKACDKILLSDDSSFYRISIPWLHVIRAHSIFLNNYEEIFEKSKLKYFYKLVFKNKLNFVGSFLLIFWKSFITIFDRRKLSFELNTDILFISHVINENELDVKRDFYFGDVPYFINESGLKCVTLLINQTSVNSSILNNKINSDKVFVLKKSLYPNEELSFFLKLLSESFKLFISSFKQSNSFLRKVYLTASKYAICSNSQNVLRINHQVSNILRKVNPKVVILTYEGHSWERCVIYNVKKLSSNTRVFAYQHSALFNLQHAIHRRISNLYDPDLILTSGLVSKDQFLSFSRFKSIPVKVFGSNRATSFSESCKSENFNNCCLVLPEGIISECFKLFKFTLEYALLNPDIIFIWRLHPLISFSDLKFSNKNLPSNIVLSKNDLISDINLCKWALYRGSTSVLTAIQAGLIPIYLKIQNEINIDPLYQISDLVDYVIDLDSFNKIVKKKVDLTIKNKIINWASKFYIPFDYNLISNEIVNNGY